MVGRGSDQSQFSAAGAGVLSRLLQARDLARIDQGGAPSLPRPQPVTVARAATNAVARAVERLYALPVTPLALDPAAITLAEMSELLPQPALLSVLEGAGEAIGVMAIDPVLMTALIEVQTLGRITARPVDSRRPTRSDAMICADFVNALLEELGGELTQLPGFEAFGGFRYASFLDDQRPLMLMLDDAGYRSLRFRIRLGQEPGREGEIFLALPQQKAACALPAQEKDQHAQRDASPSGVGRKDAADTTSAAIAGAPVESKHQTRTPPMQDAPVDVVGVLCRRRISLGTLRNLRPGHTLSLARVNLSEARLETRLGQLLAVGKLGETDGYHAIRLRRVDEDDADVPMAAHGNSTAHPAHAQPSALSFVTTSPASLPSEAPISPDAPGLQAEPPISDLGQPDGFRPATGAVQASGDFDVATALAPVQQAAMQRKIVSSG